MRCKISRHHNKIYGTLNVMNFFSRFLDFCMHMLNMEESLGTDVHVFTFLVCCVCAANFVSVYTEFILPRTQAFLNVHENMGRHGYEATSKSV